MPSVMRINYHTKAAVQRTRAKQHLRDLIACAEDSLRHLENNQVRTVPIHLAEDANLRLMRWSDAAETAVELATEWKPWTEAEGGT